MTTTCARIEAEVAAEIDAAVAFAEAEPGSRSSDSPASPMRNERCNAQAQHDRAPATIELTYRDAVREAIRDALRRDDGLSDGRGCRPLRRLLRREQRAARRVRPRAHPRHAAFGIGLHRRGHRRGDGRHAADRRGHDGQFQPARARPDSQHRGHDPSHVGRPVRRAAGHPHGDRRRAASWRPSIRTASKAGMRTFPGIKVLAPATLEDARGMLWTALAGSGPGADLRERHALQHDAARSRRTPARSISTRRRSAAPGATSRSSPMAARSGRRWTRPQRLRREASTPR